MSSSMIGVGYMALPSSCKSVGLILGLLLITMSGLASFYSGYLLLRVYRKNPCSSYPELVKIVLGNNHFIFMNFNLLSYGLFSSTMYIFFGNEIFLEVLDKYEYPTTETSRFLIKSGIFLFALFLSFHQIDRIRWFGYLANILSLYTGIILIIQSPEYLRQSRYHEILFWKPSVGCFIIIGTCFFAFTNHFSIISILKNLQNYSDHSNFSIQFRSHYLPLLLYTSVSFAGYLSFGEKTPEFILVRSPLKNSKDYLFSFG